ncbi:flagellar basal body-associated protein FliL, partial [Thermodesulfobacteriota bacterium]
AEEETPTEEPAAEAEVAKEEPEPSTEAEGAPKEEAKEEAEAPDEKTKRRKKKTVKEKKPPKKPKEKRFIHIKGRKIPLIMIIAPAAVILLFAILIPIYSFLATEGGLITIDKDTTPEKTDITAEEGIYLVEFEQFMVTLENDVQINKEPAYFILKITVEVHSELLKEEVERSKPQIRDAIVSILATKTLSKINDTAGKLKMKNEIRKEINSFLHIGRITDVYYVEFRYQI